MDFKRIKLATQNTSYLHSIHSLDDTTKNSVLIVQPWCGYSGNEELGTVCAWTGIRHGKSEWSVVAQTATERTDQER